MLSKKMQQSLNEQINVELFSGYFYLSMSSYFLGLNLEGFAHWMRMQAQEELGHAMKYYNYLNDRGAKVLFKPIEAPPSDWKSPLHAFEDALKHEKRSTRLINEQMDLAISEGDHATHFFLEWFVNEQVEEESSTNGILQKLRLISDNTSGLLMLDHNVGQRASATS